MQRRRSIPHTLADQIAAQKARLEAQVARLRHGPKKDELLEKMRQLETASHVTSGSPPWAFNRQGQPRSKAANAARSAK